MAYVMQTGKKVDANGLMAYKNIMNVGRHRISGTIKVLDKEEANKVAERIEAKTREVYSRQIEIIMKNDNRKDELNELKKGFTSLCENTKGYKKRSTVDMLDDSSTLRDVFRYWKMQTRSIKRTADRHEGNFGHIAFAELIDKPVKDIIYFDMINFLSVLREPKNNRDTNKISKEERLSEGTVRKYFMTLVMLIRYGTEAINIKKPYTTEQLKGMMPKGKSPEAKFLSKEELNTLVDMIYAAKPHELIRRYRVAFLIAIYSGCRVGEIAGTKWRDINEREMYIDINKSAGYELGTGTIIGETKTDKSKRKVYIPKQIITEILSFKAVELEYRKEKGFDISDEGYLFINPQSGKLLCPSSISRHFKDFLAKNQGLVSMNFHGIRHPYVKPALKKYFSAGLTFFIYTLLR